jgi:hypothetical protein
VLIPAAGDQRDVAAALLQPGLVLVGARTCSRYASPTWCVELDHAGATMTAPLPRRLAASQYPAKRAFLHYPRNCIETLIVLLKHEHSLEDQSAHS